MSLPILLNPRERLLRLALLALLALTPAVAPAQFPRPLRVGIAEPAAPPSLFRRADDHRYLGAAIGAGLYVAGFVALALYANAADDDGLGRVNIPYFVGVGAGFTLLGGLIGSAFPKGK